VEPTAEEHSTWSCAADTLAPGQSTKFQLFQRGKPIEAFIINTGGAYHAYVNRCPHAGTPLDLWPNEFLTEDGRHLVCSTHGAIFERDTGLCVEGPCPGASLERLAVARDGRRMVVSCPT
jgi:nitrite reductase/ring-hydroxylating ferredoxin subunit